MNPYSITNMPWRGLTRTKKGFMKIFVFSIVLLFVSVMINPTLAQENGSLYGKIMDSSTGEELIGANIFLEGTNIGAASDLEGNYEIRNIPPGTYSLIASMVGYTKITVSQLEIKADEQSKLYLSLVPEAFETEEVVVTADALKNLETSVLKIQKNSGNIVDGVSAELINKNNSSDGTDVLKRMSGVTISDGKYAFVRGVGDRYNNTLLNGANLPSTDPEKKSFSYDIFPASLIENVITAKTFTPDKPADFSGGLVQINTIEFPSRFTFNFSTTTGYNTNTSLKSFSSYNGGSTDFLGIDDGTRDFPSTITTTRISRGNYSDDELVDITKSFKNNWNVTSNKAPIDESLKFTLGDKYNLSDSDVLGYVASMTYSHSNNFSDRQKNFFDYDGARYLYNGTDYSSNVMWSGLANISYKFGLKNKLSFKNVYTQNTDDETTLYKGDYRYASQYREITSLKFVSRSLLSNQFIGEHQIDLFNGLNFDWLMNYSRSERNEPDTRRYAYFRPLDNQEANLRFLLDPSIATRYYGELNDHDYSAAANLNFTFFENPTLPKLKVGAYYDKKDRDFDARLFGFRNIAGSYSNEDSVLQLPVEQIFSPENINKKFIMINEITKPSDSYDSNQKIAAGYGMVDMLLFEKLRIVAGVRFEYSNQKLISGVLTNDVIEISHIYRDWLPAVNLTYLLNPQINLRLAYSKTLARPEFRELSPFTYFDFLSSELVQGNTQLQRSLIENYDLRFELFPSAGELAAVSFFYKIFNDPIEEILMSSSSNEPIRSYANADEATNYGVEIEIRKNLSFLTDLFRNLSFVGNISLIHSRVNLGNSNGYQVNERPLQGQADYVFNVGLYYDDVENGLNTSVVYNKVGPRISKVGVNELGNFIERPVDLIDISLSKTLIYNFTAKLALKDLLNQDKEVIQQSVLGDRTSELIKTGRTVSLGLSYQL